MSQWITVTLRCWIAFIAFTNFGAAFRCFTEDNFVHSKFFGKNLTTIEPNEGQVMERMYGFWSLLNGIILLNTFFFIEEIKILILSICVILLYLSFFAVEGYFYKTVQLHGPTIYPCTLNGLTLLWLLISLRYPAKKTREELDENEVLRKQFHFKSLSRKMK